MKATTLFNLIWLCVWAILGMGCLAGLILGNYAHIVGVAGSGYFVYLLFTDNEDGESVREYLTRKFKESK